MRRRPSRLIYAALTFLAATAAAAADQDGPDDDGPPDDSKPYSWGLGIGGITKQQSYIDIDRDTMIVPLIYFENRWVQLLGPRLDFKLPGLEWGDHQELSFALGIEFDGGGYEPADAPILNGMAKRKDGLLAGGSAKWSNPFLEMSASWMVDALNEHKGQQIKFGLEKQFHVGEHFMITPSVSAIWLDRKYADYYYGVRASEARAGRPAYTVDSTLNTEISLRADYLIDEHQAVFVSFGYTALGSEIKDSPLVDGSGETMGFLGYLYRF